MTSFFKETTVQDDFSGQFRSPGGFIFGVQGWMWGPPRPSCITFFIDNTAKVCDQYGRPIRGAIIGNKEIRFAINPPNPEDNLVERRKLATHVQVIEALAAEQVNWQTLTYAGFPQLPYADLKKVKQLPPTPIEDLLKIANPILRRDAVKMRKELNDIMDKEREEAGLMPEWEEET